MTPDSTGGGERHGDEQPDAGNNGEKIDPRESSADDAQEAATPDLSDDSSDDFGDEEAIVEEYVDPDVQSRLWLKAVVPLLQLRSHETDPNGRVQFAFDLMYIAACERIARILRSDVATHP